MDVSQFFMTMMEAASSGATGIDSAFNVTAMVKDVAKWMTGLIPLAGACGVGYQSVCKSTAQDEQQAAQHNKSIRGILAGTALGTAASGVIGLLASYAGKGPV